MEKHFVTYNQALALKELGFDEPCFGIYFPSDKSWKDIKFKNSQQDNIVASPLKSQLFEWIRTKYKYYFWIEPCSQHKIFHFNITCSPSSFTYCTIDEKKPNAGGFKSYEEAELACIDKLIEIVKNR